MPRPLIALIDPSAMRHNLMQAKALAPAARAWAVIKANAYGHGLQAAMQGLHEADGFALLEFDNALALREADPQRRLLMLEGAFDAPDTEQAARYRLELVVHDEAQLRWIEALDGPRRLAVWLKFNNGMNRLGFARGHFRQAFERLVGLPAVSRISLMTHFANADAEHGCDDALARFEQAAKGLPGDRSLANSAATVQVPGAHGQ